MSDIFQEVDEELKRQHMDKALKTYGPIAVGAVLVILGGVASFNFWQGYQERQADAAGNQLIQGMEFLALGQQDLAAAVFAGLGDSAPEGYALLARFHEAAALRQSGDTASALSLYDEISENSATDQEFRDLARFYSGLAALGNSASTFEDIELRLAPVAEGAGPWRFHAAEALAYAAFRDNRFEDAATRYAALTDDPATPAGIAARATEMLNLTEAAAE